ncbi:hypothetical protein HXX76_007291 [Chlamydomonas incerta]|uniref:Uncharacterized protein n=1 Tax=Chlamydomonas incerta TaxID=51695 RepID=A0A835W2V1_CHLIN|nr:hypothetical protein HXX76_007291 [Chlamydomonas incerta]|eukprot:KAG2435208.1 hypothetical protein HXX76_007291 [Chlamydomonas incerta]
MSPDVAHAEMQVVSAQQATQMAKPLPKQTFDKGRVWTVVIGSAAALFVGTVLLENNPALFPAISRANQAMKEATKRMQEMEERQKKEAEVLALRQKEFDTQQRSAAAVEQGLKAAKAKVLAQSPQAAPKPAAPAAAAAPAPAPAAVASTSAPAAAAEPHQAPAPAAPASTSATANSGASSSYVVVEDVSGDLGAQAWTPAGTTGTSTSSAPAASENSTAVMGAAAATAMAAAAVKPPAAAAAVAEEEAESVARLARLQNFVDTMASRRDAVKQQ